MTQRTHSNFLLLLIFFLILPCYLCKVSNGNVKPNSEQKRVLQRTVQTLLDFQKNPPGEKLRRQPSRSSNVASKYMRRLFEQYTQNGFGLDGNIVRSITPIAGVRNGRNVLVFKLHAIRADEQIVRAELHFNQRHKMNPLKWHDRRIFEAAASCESCARRGISMLPLERLPTPSKQWISWEARDMVDDVLRSNASELVVELTRKGNYLNPDILIKRNTPFLLVYSGSASLLDKSKLPLDLLQQHSTAPPAYQESDEESDEDIFMKKRGKRSVDALPENYYAYSNQVMDKEEYKQRRAQLDEFRKNGPKKVLKTKKHKKIRHRKPYRYDPDDPMMGFGSEPIENNEISETKIHSNRISDSPDPHELSVFLLNGESYHSEKQSCSRRDMIVDFRDIGWEDWIIAPKSFEAHYCAGSCPYPLESEVNPSNHAIIQSIIKTIGLNPSVPGVCCSPEKMDSLTLLYYDEMDNVVMKTYPKMVVSSCGCL